MPLFQTMATISSALWTVPLQGTVAHAVSSEKLLARMRWLALGIWGALLGLNPSSAGLLFVQYYPYYIFAGAAYCFFGQYLAYRHYKGRPVTFPIGLTDIVFVLALCGASGGLFSPVYVYFYGLTLIAALRFDWRAGLGVAVTTGAASVALLFLVPPVHLSASELYQDLAFRMTLLFGLAGLAGLFSSQKPSQKNVPQSESTPPSPYQLDNVQEKLTTLEVESLSQQLVDIVSEHIPCRGVSLVLFDPDTHKCVGVAVAGSFPRVPAPLWEQALTEGGALRAALDLGPTVLNTAQDIYARFQTLSNKKIARRHLFIHEIGEIGQNLTGCFLLADRIHHNETDEPDATEGSEGFSSKDNQVLADIAQYAVPAIQNAYHYEEAKRESTELRGLLHAILNSQEEERQRVVSEWHDQLGEKLFRVLQDFRGCQEFVLQHAPEGRERFAKLASEIDEIAALVRQSADDLLPPVLEDFGFVEALRSYVSGLQEHEPFEVVMQAENDSRALPTQTSRKLFRITQEALQNIQKHAKANHVQIALTFEQQGLSLMIKDDGQGFQPEPFTPGHYGLLYMREQAVACGGRLSVQSEQGHGTEVRVELPVDEEAASEAASEPASNTADSASSPAAST